MPITPFQFHRLHAKTLSGKDETNKLKTENYKKYFDLSKNKITTDLYNTYNSYLENKYEININYQTLAKTKNYF